MNIAQWSDENLRRFGDYEALAIGDRTWTAAELHGQACRLAQAFVSHGIVPGDRVLLLLPACPEIFVASAAIWRCGAVVVLGYSGSPAAEIESIVRHCAPAALVAARGVDADGAAAMVRLAILVGAAGAAGVAGESEPGRGWTRLDSFVDGHEELSLPIPREAQDPAQISYTSGTTDKPKGVVYTHGGMNARLKYFADIREPFAQSLYGAAIHVLPPGSYGGLLLNRRFIGNQKLIILEKFDPENVLAEIEKRRATSLVLVPSMCEALLAVRGRGHDCSSLLSVQVSGAHISDALYARIEERFGVRPFTSYGTTEAGGGITSNLAGRKPGSTGRTLPGVTLQIIDEASASLAAGQIGEVHVRTPWAAQGYYLDPDETSKVFHEDWVHTGDAGYVDNDGELFLVGRLKDVIIQSGFNVYPQELVLVIQQIPGVQECAIIGVPNAFLGEEAVACVVAAPGAAPTEFEILSHCGRLLEPRKLPSRVRFFESLPKTPNGKLHTSLIREKLQAEISATEETETSRRIAAAPAERRRALAEALIREELARELSAGPASIDIDAVFGDLGLTSLGAVRLTMKLSGLFGLSLPATLTFSHSSVSALTGHILGRLLGGQGEPSNLPARSAAISHEDIAIVGMACRLPGGVSTPEEFWRLLCEERDVTSEWPRERPAGTGVRAKGAFLDRADLFDGQFFRMAGEAVDIDPQQRLLLEVCWEALEQSGRNPLAAGPAGFADAAGSGPVGVFVGITGNGYKGAHGLGSASSMSVARICHFLNLNGPAMAIDTTCSSSMVALHSAVQSLKLGESGTALVGGVQVIADPFSFSRLGQLGVLAPDGRSKSFDSRADGYGRGEGCIVLVLKRLSDAVSQGDRIHAIIRGSAINHDGRSSSLTAPNPRAQEDVICKAFAAGGVSPADVQYVETHGTGTLLGDPLEIEALATVFGERSIRLAIGSVKTNVGHLESGAGLAGLLKTVLALKNRELPASLHFEKPNPHIPWEKIPISVQAKRGPWPDPGRRLLAGVSSFGMSGTNAHVLVEAGPPEERAATTAATAAGRPLLLPLSARTPRALQALVQRYEVFLAEPSTQRGTLEDIAYTASCRRAHLECRIAVAGRSEADWLGKLRLFTRDATEPLKSGPKAKRGVAMVFGGQGAQWKGMGQDLFNSEPVFRAAVQECAARIDRYASWSLIEELTRDEATSRIDATEIAQPVLFALQVGLYELWKSWGVEPDVVLGHSLGEIAAAYAARAVSLDAAAQLVVERGRIQQAATGLGKMISVSLGSAEIERLLTGFPDVEIAATNAPKATVLAGPPAAIDNVQKVLESRGVRCAIVSQSYAFHSAQMDLPAARLTAALREWSAGTPELPMISTVSGDIAPALDAVYWGQQVRKPVRFSAAILKALERGCGLFVEVSPQPVLSPAIAQIAEESGTPVVLAASMRRRAAGPDSMLDALGALYTAGYPVDWKRQYPVRRPVVDVPLYPWQHESYWADGSGESAEAQMAGRESWAERLYATSWKAVPRAEGAEQAEGKETVGPWLLFADASGVADHLRARLEDCGERVLCVRASDAGRAGENEDYDKLLGDVFSASVPGAIVHLCSLAAPRTDESTADGIDDSQRFGCLAVMRLLQALSRKRWSRAPRLFLLTRGAQPVEGGVTSVAQSPMWGFGASIAREFPELRTTLIDLDPHDVGSEGLCDELLRTNDEDRIALRGGQRWVARLVPHAVARPVPSGPPVRSDRTYLVTGGLGGLALVIARRLVDMGAASIALLGRKGPTDEARLRIAEMERAGARVETVRCDVCSAAELDGAIRYIEGNMPPLAGVVHAAGILDDGILLNLSEERVRAVMAPKVRGAWNLHVLFKERPLDFFILFSSIAGVFGSAGQSHYAAGNTFLDALAHARRDKGLCGQSIAWGGWAETGMAARMEPALRVASRLRLMSSAEGADLFESVLRDSGAIQVTALAAQPAWWRSDSSGPVRPLLRELVSGGTPQTGSDPVRAAAPPHTADRPPLSSSYEQPRDTLEAELETIWSGLLGLGGLGIHDNFFELGGDSLVATRVVSRIRDRLGFEMPLQAIFDQPTIAQLAAELRKPPT